MKKIAIQAAVYLIAVLVGGGIGVLVYNKLRPFHQLGSLGRWFARCLACVLGTMTFVGIFLATGQGAILSRTGEAPSWPEGMTIAVLMGLAYGTLWPVAKYMRRYP